MKTKINLNNVTTGITHAGVFHADDVFSAALLTTVNPAMEIKRVRIVPDDIDESTTIVFDIGGGEFDHHFANSPERENGTKYSSFGLLWREFGEVFVKGKENVKYFDEKFVQYIDDADNGGNYNPLTDTISSFNPNWNESQDFNTAFNKAVEFARVILTREFARINSAELARGEVQTALDESDNGIVVLKRFAPWQKILVPSDAKFVISPSPRGGYNAQCVPTELGTTDQKIPFPAEWVGNKGIDGLLFCHPARFLINTADLESAVKLCKVVLTKEVK